MKRNKKQRKDAMHRENIMEIGHRLIGAVQDGGFWNGRIQGVWIVINPAAGLLARHGVVRRVLSQLVRAGASYGRVGGGEPLSVLQLTEYPGHGREIGRIIGQHIRSGTSLSMQDPQALHGPGTPLLVVTIGGDGTHDEVLSGILDSGCDTAGVRVLRLPMGSGNDSADVTGMDQALCVLHGDAVESPIPAVEVNLAGGERLYAFNITSFGLDACVVWWTNKLKRSRLFPGDSYKLVADLVSLFYSPSFKRGPMRLLCKGSHISAGGEGAPGAASPAATPAATPAHAGGEVLTGDFVLTAIGASGHRVYGKGKRVLPGAENLCTIRNLSMLQRIPLRGQFYRGDHVLHPHTTMREVEELTVEFGSRIYFQADGESRMLQPHDFPVQVRVLTTAFLHVSAETDCGQTRQTPPS
ncbi:MAG: diacylglycerol/lipid kinase family protein [Spirochaeta sp.]